MENLDDIILGKTPQSNERRIVFVVEWMVSEDTELHTVELGTHGAAKGHANKLKKRDNVLSVEIFEKKLIETVKDFV